MACSKPDSTIQVGKASCPCDDEDANPDSTSKCQPFLRSAIGKYEERCKRLYDRERLLHDKISIMERSLPALMAMSMCRGGQGGAGSGHTATRTSSQHKKSALGQVRELMKNLAPRPDPADELAAEIAAQAEQLESETAELHDRIIKADIELEESSMEIESLELANRDLAEQIETLEEQQLGEAEPLGAADRLCLGKLRDLGAEGARLERIVQDLEMREMALRGDIEKIIAGPCPKGPCESSCAGRKHRPHGSKRRMKDCLQVEPTVESLFERDKDKPRKKQHCDALSKMMELNPPQSCTCHKKQKQGHRKTESCEKLAQKFCCQQQKSDKPPRSRERKRSKKRSRARDNRSSSKSSKMPEKPMSPPRYDDYASQSCTTLSNVASSMSTRRGDTSIVVARCNEQAQNPACVIVVKACECNKGSDMAPRDTRSEYGQHPQMEILEKIFCPDSERAPADPWSVTVANPVAEENIPGVFPKMASVNFHREQLLITDDTVSIVVQNDAGVDAGEIAALPDHCP